MGWRRFNPTQKNMKPSTASSSFAFGHFFSRRQCPLPRLIHEDVIVFEGTTLKWAWRKETIASLAGIAKRCGGRWTGPGWDFASAADASLALKRILANSAKRKWGYRAFYSAADFDIWERKRFKSTAVTWYDFGDSAYLVAVPLCEGGRKVFDVCEAEASVLIGDTVFFKGSASARTKIIAEGWHITVGNEQETVELHMDGWSTWFCATPGQAAAIILDAASALRQSKRWSTRDGHVFHFWKSDWELTEKVIRALGLPCRTFQPEPPIIDPIDLARIPGHEKPSPDGKLMYSFQKACIPFFLKNHQRALIGDEMGLGKTAEAIACAGAIAAQRILVVCPAGIRLVWESEILSWRGEKAIIATTRQTVVPSDAKWLVTSYEGLLSPSRTWVCTNNTDADRLKAWLTKKGADSSIDLDSNWPTPNSTREFRISKFPDGEPPEWFPPVERKKWVKLRASKRNALLASIVAWKPDFLIVDEAHRIKSARAARSDVINRLSETVPSVLLLTGTPIRNSHAEAVSLVRAINPALAEDLEAQLGKEAVREMLSHVMLRRTREEVNINVAKPRRRLLSVRMPEPVGYAETLASLVEPSAEDLAQGRVGNQMGVLARLRHELGLAKASNSEVIALLGELAFEQREAGRGLVVFTHHRNVGQTIADKLESLKYRVGRIHGDIPQVVRDETIEDFQKGRLQILVVSIMAGNEGVSYTHADMAVFVELEWVPSDLEQAESRIARIGQTSTRCDIVQLVARFPSGNSLDEIVLRVIARKEKEVNFILGQQRTVVGEEDKTSLPTEVLRELLLSRKHPKSESEQH
jgi:hypothetical protein